MATFLIPGLALATLVAPVAFGTMIERERPLPTPMSVSAPAASILSQVQNPVPAHLATQPLPGFESYEFVEVDGHRVVIDAETRKVVEIF
jgi:hypothetical protein